MRMSNRPALIATIVTAMLVLAAPAALADKAEPSGADRMLAAGGGQHFTASTGAGHRAASCFDDPADDVVNLEDDEAPIDEPRGDIVSHCLDHGVTAVTLSATMATPTDPETDTNWDGLTVLGWFIDTTGDGNGEFFVQLTKNPQGQLDPTVEDRRGEGAAETACQGLYYSYAEGTVTVRFGRDCVGDPASIAVNVGIVYDQRVSDADGVATFDTAPDGGETTEALPAGALTDPGVNRVDGDERIESAVLGSQAAFNDGAAEAVVIARADVAADAQTGTPLAIATNAPLLLSANDGLSAMTAEEIQRVLPAGGPVYLLGGEAALSEQVATDAAELGYEVTRLGGANRFETAAVIAADGLGGPATAILADGAGFTDALVAGAASWAIANQPGFAQDLPAVPLPTLEEQVGAVLLTDGTRLPDETAAYLESIEPANTATVGAPAGTAYPDADIAYAGDTPAATSVVVAEALFTDPTIAGLATDSEFADALFGGALVGDPDVGPGPLLLTNPSTLSGEVEQYLIDQSGSLETVVIFGGPGAVSQDVEHAVVATQA